MGLLRWSVKPAARSRSGSGSRAVIELSQEVAGLDVGEVLESARDRLEQVGLLA
jgi:hypothetical protein